MKHSQRFETAIHRLVKAFFDGTLKKGVCASCAVGTMCNGYGSWYILFATDKGSEQKRSGLNALRAGNFPAGAEIEKKLLIRTGYDADDLAKIESVFEKATKIIWYNLDDFPKEAIMQDQFNGLMAVVDVLCEIEGIDAQPVKEYFSFDETLKPVKELVEL